MWDRPHNSLACDQISALPHGCGRTARTSRAAWAPPERFRAGIAFGAKPVLELAVVLLGAALSLATLWAAGPGLLVGIAAVIGADGEDVAASIAFTAVLGVLMVLALPLLVPLLALSPVAQLVEDHGARIMARDTDRSQSSDPPQAAPTPVQRRRRLPGECAPETPPLTLEAGR